MNRRLFVRRIHIEASADEVFHWHARPGAFERLLPPWERVKLLRRAGGIENGSETEISVRIGPFRRRWLAVHSGYVEGRQFRDEQVRGPFARWEHRHCMEPDGPRACYLEDRIEYALPGGAAGDHLGHRYIEQKLNRLFDYRHATTLGDVLAHGRWPGQPPLKVAISGASGLIGRALGPFLTTGGHTVVPLVRTKAAAGPDVIFWNPGANHIEQAKLAGVDAVVQLAGENIAGARWTPESKERFRISRLQSTRLLCDAITRMAQPPKVMVCASAIGYYGKRGAEILTEADPGGSGYLAELTRDWEAAAEPARQLGVRVVHLRLGMVLSPAGGALGKMLPIFKLGAGGTLGGGAQYWSWIGIDDAIGAIHHALMNDELHGAVNAVAPESVTNREFTKILGKVLQRPTILPVPAAAARMAFGEMADHTMLASIRVAPKRLQEAGHVFRHAHLEAALRHLLGEN
jgi:uncharacterized protein (TIGR01777 family)